MFSFPVYAFVSVILRGLNYGRLLGVLECCELEREAWWELRELNEYVVATANTQTGSSRVLTVVMRGNEVFKRLCYGWGIR